MEARLFRVAERAIVIALFAWLPPAFGEPSDALYYDVYYNHNCTPKGENRATVQDALNDWWTCRGSQFAITYPDESWGECSSRMEYYDSSAGEVCSFWKLPPFGIYPSNSVACMSITGPWYCEDDVTDYVVHSCQDRQLGLVGGGTVEPNGTLTGFTATVIGCYGTPVSGLEIQITTDAKAGSGYHVHSQPRPQPQISAASQTNADGQISFSVKAPAASGTYFIHASCEGCSTATALIDVKVSNLHALAQGLYVFETAGTGSGHPDSSRFHLTNDARTSFRKLAIEYVKVFGQFLYVNDASLPTGGLFDVNKDWTKPHKEHRCGRAVDLRGNGNSNTGAVPEENMEDFELIANHYGIDVHKEDDPPHFHLWLLGLERKETADIVAGVKTCSQLP